MAELADALDLGSSEETRTGSIPARRTIRKTLRQPHYTMYYGGKIVAFFEGSLNHCFCIRNIHKLMNEFDYK